MKNFKSIIFSVLCFALGIAVFYRISDSINIPRDPASLHEQMNHIAGINPADFKSEIERKIKISNIQQGKEKAILFEGFSSNLCRSYETVELEFFAEGVSVAGEPTTMKISAPCEPAQDPAEMASIRIPVEKILNENPKDAEFSFSGFKGKYTFSKSADEWPRIWILRSVEFRSLKNTSKMVKFDHFSYDKNKPVVLEF